jgi:predicted neutral ceramidase superfamily lipid hydrolase
MVPEELTAKKPAPGQQNPLKHPNFNQEIVDLIQKSREDALKEVKKLELKVAEQAKAIKILRSAKKEGGDLGNVKSMSMVGLGVAIIALLLAIMGMVM